MKPSSRVLIVDDRAAVRQTLRNILLGFNCIFSEAASGMTALELMRANDFDVVFLDLKLPDLSGIEIMRKAHDLGNVLGKVIILTGLPESSTKADAETLGVFRYLTKDPIDWAQVRSAFVEAISDSTAPSTAPTSKPRFRRVIREGAAPQDGRGPRIGARRRSRPRLLVLDDQQSWLDTMKRVLRNDFELSLTTSADEAYKRVRKESFALVVLDMRLVGGVSGLDVLKRMRRSVPALRAIILTGYPDNKSAMETKLQGALAYVSKGELPTLTKTVRRILDAPERKYADVKARYHALINRKYLDGLSPSENQELSRLEDTLEEMDKPYYDVLLRRLRTLVDKRGTDS